MRTNSARVAAAAFCFDDISPASADRPRSYRRAIAQYCGIARFSGWLRIERAKTTAAAMDLNPSRKTNSTAIFLRAGECETAFPMPG